MSISPFMAALNQLCDEKGLPKEIVISTVEAALAAAYRKDYGNSKMVVRAKFNDDDFSKTEMFQVFKIVEDEEFDNEYAQIKISEALKNNKKTQLGEEILEPMPHHDEFGRIAAQTAKQVIIQRLQEAERKILFQEYKDKQNQLINGMVQQIEGKNIIINIGKTNAIIPPNEQIPNEKYYLGQRLKVYVTDVEETNRGPKIIVSRSHPNLVRELFALEVPEIASGTVTIDNLAREAGSRTKIAVSAHQEGLDPVGSCVGQRGIRVQAVLAELGEEKVDIILFDKDLERFIANALSPAKIVKIKLDKKNNKARVYVDDDQLSLAIGRGGQNVRLASKLAGWGIDIEKQNLIKKAKKESEKEENQPNQKIKEVKNEVKVEISKPDKPNKVVKKNQKN